MAKIKISELGGNFDGKCKTKVMQMGNITEVVTMEKTSAGCPCYKVDKDHYCDSRTGEILEYSHYENRSDGLESIRQTLCKIRALINTNVIEPEFVRWVTLTYWENMTDAKRLYKDYFRFWKRFCYWCSKQGIEKPEYITVQEPQGRGAWHVHAFFIWDKKAPFVPNEEMSKLWGNGFTVTKSMQNVDNVGAYFSAYLGDIPLDEVEKLPPAQQVKAKAGTVEVKEFSDEQGFTKVKRFIKGGRLFMYPPGMNIVRKTKGIKEPIVEYMNKEQAEKKVSAATETFHRVYEIIDDDGTVINRISKSYYNKTRKKSNIEQSMQNYSK